MAGLPRLDDGRLRWQVAADDVTELLLEHLGKLEHDETVELFLHLVEIGHRLFPDHRFEGKESRPHIIGGTDG